LGLNRNSPEENILKQLADSTGGLYFYSPTSSDLEAIYRAISRLLHHRYRVSYTTHNQAKDGTKRHVQIRVHLRTNSSADTASYIAPYEEPPDPPPPDPPPDPPPPDPPPPEPPPPEDVFEVIPNPFTPNDDGFNDQVEFKRGDDIPEGWVIIIMDRIGREIRRLDNGARYWNGRNESGFLMLPGSYLYIVLENKKILHRGLVQLIR
jgi:gliding motility-associated-like protein